MPPEVYHCHHLATQKTPLLSRLSPKSRFNPIFLHQKYCQKIGGRMKKFIKKKLIPVLVFILCSASIFRFLNISMITTNSPARNLRPIHCSSEPSICRKNISHPQAPSNGRRSMSANSSSLTKKETQFLMEFFKRRIPCNLLIFGHESQYSTLASLNAGGFTIFMEDHLHKKSTIKSTNNTKVHKITYNTLASEAYQLLRDARENPDCWPKSYLPEASRCALRPLDLPQAVHDTMWDVVVVDGPCGATPDSPGRMASIYTASILARRGNTTHVIVHDVDRMVEKWFSWEFLCEENLIASKGRFWHFQILGVTNATKFCAS